MPPATLVNSSRPAGAERNAAVFGPIIRLVVDVAPAEGAGIEAVLGFIRRGCYHRAVKLGVVFDPDGITVFARKQQPIAEFFQVITGPQKRAG